MAKKKPKTKPLDEAAVARIAARRERKAANRDARELARAQRAAKLAEEARWHSSEAVAAREVEHAARLANAALVLQRGDTIIAGLLPQTEEGWELIHRNGAIRPSTHMDTVEAVMLLCTEAYPSKGDVLSARNVAGASLLSETRESLNAEYRAGELHPLDEDTFYDYFADEDTRKAIDARRDEWNDKDGLPT